MSNRPPGFEAVGKEPGFEKEAQARASLLLPRKDTLKSLLQSPERASVFKLQALADNFFGPLHDVLGKKEYLLGTDAPTSVDCLLYGFLALMLFPKVSQDWLASTMRLKYKQLAAFTERIHNTLALNTNAEDVVRLARCETEVETLAQPKVPGTKLPWSVSPKLSIADTAKSIITGMLKQTPLLGSSNALELLNARKAPMFGKYMKAILLSTTASVGLVGYLALSTGLLVWPHGEEVHIFGRKHYSDFGHLGSALAGINLLRPHPGRGP
jgi:sorting and assembly machinery component 37